MGRSCKRLTDNDLLSSNRFQSPGNDHLEDCLVKYRWVMIVLFVSAFNGGSTNIDAEDLPVRNQPPFGEREHVVRQINGEYEPAR
jgi:hypothetical protein